MSCKNIRALQDRAYTPAAHMHVAMVAQPTSVVMASKTIIRLSSSIRVSYDLHVPKTKRFQLQAIHILYEHNICTY